MDLEVLTVGTELLLGFTLDSNTADIGIALASAGWRVTRSSCVGDSSEAIRDAVRDALARTGVVVVTGGLGPTRDDVTKRAVAGIFDAPLDLDEAYLTELKVRYEKFGRGPLPEANRCQAEIPRGAKVLPNPRGTAPGLWLAGDHGVAILLPGVPLEMRLLLEREVVPRLREVARTKGDAGTVILSRTLRTTGTSESQLATIIGAVEQELGELSLAYLPGVDGVDLRLTVWGCPASEAESALKRGVRVLRPVLGECLYGQDDQTLAATLVETLRSAKLRLSVAESCTGGMIGARLTGVPGASEVFAGGIICYENGSKTRDLGVAEGLIQDHGAVSEPVVRAMAAGACRRFETDASVAITGIAGPGGGSEEKPVGTVWIAAQAGSHIKAAKRWYSGDRDEVRQRSAQAGLDLLRRLLVTAGICE